MKSIAVIAAMAFTLMGAGCMHEQPPIGGAKAGTTGSVPKTTSRSDRREGVVFAVMAWFSVIILMAVIWIVLDL